MKRHHKTVMMIRALGVSLVLAVSIHVGVRAQQVSGGINVLPVWMPCDPADPACASNPGWANAWKYGDAPLQRQVEPTVATSTLNSEHVLTGVIDYGAVEVPNDTGLGG